MDKLPFDTLLHKHNVSMSACTNQGLDMRKGLEMKLQISSGKENAVASGGCLICIFVFVGV